MSAPFNPWSSHPVDLDLPTTRHNMDSGLSAGRKRRVPNPVSLEGLTPRQIARKERYAREAEQERARRITYYAANKKIVRAKQLAYYWTNREKIITRMRVYRQSISDRKEGSGIRVMGSAA